MKLIGWSGVAFGIGIFAVTWLILSRRTSKELSFALEITERAFEKTLATYLDIAKFILGLAADGIVLVIGSSALGQTKQLPAGYAPPLFLLAMCIFYGIVFMPLLTLNYESFKNKVSAYSRRQYIGNRALGYSSLACFCVGYGRLVWAAVGN